MPSPKVKCGITEHPSYRGPISGETAQQKLKEAGKDCYLIRYSAARDKYILTVARKGGDSETLFQHFAIQVTAKFHQNEYEVEGAEKKFDDMVELLEFYQNNPLNHDIDSIGACYSPS